MNSPLLLTANYAGLLACLFVYLSVRTLRLRKKLRIPIGDASNDQMLRAMRVHANFSEYVPLSLLLLLLMEIQGAHPMWLHTLGSLLLLGRIFHALGVSQAPENTRWRLWGMRLTLGVLSSCAGYLLVSQMVRSAAAFLNHP